MQGLDLCLWLSVLLAILGLEARLLPRSNCSTSSGSSISRLGGLAFLHPNASCATVPFAGRKNAVVLRRVGSPLPAAAAAIKETADCSSTKSQQWAAGEFLGRRPSSFTTRFWGPHSSSSSWRRSGSCLWASQLRGSGKGEGFLWAETPQQVRLEVLVDSSVRPQDIQFELKSRCLRVAVKGHEPLIQGTLTGRVDASECVWFLEPYTPPLEQQQQQRKQQAPAAKRLTVLLAKHRGSGSLHAGLGQGAHWGFVFQETAAAEAASAAYDPLPHTGRRQANPFFSNRAPGEILAEFVVPPSLLGELPPLPPDEPQQQQQQPERERLLLRQGLSLLDLWAHARDNGVLLPPSGAPPRGGLLEAFGCPHTLLHIQVQPLPDGVLLLFMQPDGLCNSSNSSSSSGQQALQQVDWPDDEGVELRLTFSDVRPKLPGQQEQQQQQPQQQQSLHLVALRRSAGAAALQPFGSEVYRHLQDAEQRIIGKLQQDMAAAAASPADGWGSQLLPGVSPQQQQQQGGDGGAFAKLIRMEQQRLNAPPAAAAAGHAGPRGGGVLGEEETVKVIKATPPLEARLNSSSPSPPHAQVAGLGPQQQQPPHAAYGTDSAPAGAAAGGSKEQQGGRDRSEAQGEGGEDAAAAEREKFGIKLLDLSSHSAAVPSFMKPWSPERRRAFQKDTANAAVEKLKEAAAPPPHLRFTDLELLLRQQLNCTQEEFREAWQGGYDRCEQQEKLLLQQQQQQRKGGFVGMEQQQAAFFYVQQFETAINSPGDSLQLLLDSHAAAAAAAGEAHGAAAAAGEAHGPAAEAAAAAATSAAAEEAAMIGDDREEAGVPQRAYSLDPLGGPPADLAPPHKLREVPALEAETPRHHRYLLMDQEQRRQVQHELRQELARFDLLISELEAETDRGAWLHICEQYKDLLLGESYFLLLTIRLMEKPPAASSRLSSAQQQHDQMKRKQGSAAAATTGGGGPRWAEEERERLRFVNRFVLSLYEDLGALLQANEATQLKKVKLLCMQAVQDISKLNEYAESMKPLFNQDFFAYLLSAIQEERKRIARQGLNPDAAPSQWLLILLVIQKGVLSLFEKEDVLDLGFILIQQQPDVRRKLLELWIARLPKCDWRQFKLLGLKLAQRFTSGDYSPVAVSAYPWVPEAARQLGRDLEQLLPEWLIEGMLSDFDRHVMQTLQAQRPFLFTSVDPPKPPPEGSPQALCADVKKHMQQQIEDATRAFQERASVDEFTGEAVG
ncbi:hypothetical protein Esti_001037 [Eimeria stiedai]